MMFDIEGLMCWLMIIGLVFLFIDFGTGILLIIAGYLVSKIC